MELSNLFFGVPLGDILSVKTRSNNKRVRGIEPLSLAWKAKVLPLNYTRRVLTFRF
jgi:hypothetical protein